MLLDLPPSLIDSPWRKELLGFLQHPYSETSCALVEERLPGMRSLYREMGRLVADKTTRHAVSMAHAPEQVFRPVTALGNNALRIMPLHLLAAQVILLEEDRRDSVERARRTAGAATEPDLDIDASILALRAMSLHEAAFLSMAEAFVLHVARRQIEFALTARGREWMSNRVLSVSMQNQTEGAFRALLRMILEKSKASAAAGIAGVTATMRPELLDLLAQSLLDTHFSISSSMQSDPALGSTIDGARRLCKWFVLLEICRLAGESGLAPGAPHLRRLGLDTVLLDEVLAGKQAAPHPDRGLYRLPSGLVTLGGASLAHAVDCCKSAVLGAEATRKIGDQFERHIIRYVQEEIPASDYMARPGFGLNGKADGRNYDCDVVIYEPGRKKLFFLQVKWKRDGRTANLEDELLDWGDKNWPISKAVDQLEGLRERLAERRVLDQVKGALKGIRLSDQDILENAHYVVVHTLPYFNAYAVRGVAIYQWNFFRNVLLGGAVTTSVAPESDFSRLEVLPVQTNGKLLPLERPGDVLADYCSKLGATSAKLQEALRDRCESKYGFDMDNPGASAWACLVGRRHVRIVRPYL